MVCGRTLVIFRITTITCAFIERWMVPHGMCSRRQRNIGAFVWTTIDGKATAGAFISYGQRRND